MTMPRAAKNVQETGLSYIADKSCKIGQPVRKMVWKFLSDLNICIPHDPGISLLGIYASEAKTYVHRKTEKKKVALFVITKTWKQTNKLWYIYKTDH